MLRTSTLIPGVRFDKLSARLSSAQCGLSLSKPIGSKGRSRTTLRTRRVTSVHKIIRRWTQNKKREESRLKVQLIQGCYMTRRFQADVEIET